MTSALFAATMFLSAALLFVLQPMIGKQLLPLAGGTPAVWSTCLVFFQSALLLGYLYAHRLARAGTPVGRQLATHVGTMAVGLILVLLLGRLKPDPTLIPDVADAPVLGLVIGLAACVGGPFLVLAATAPLLQRWFAAASRRDPYPLYAASNGGSLVGLLGYPLLIEPALTLPDQRAWWMQAFAGCLALIGVCGWVTVSLAPRLCGGRGPGVRGVFASGEATMPAGEPPPSPRSSPPEAGGEGAKRVLRWIGLSALTSSLLMSVTAHLTTDVAAVPLLWAVPLALYLITFILVFARWPDRLHRFVGRVTPMALCALAVAWLTRATEPPAAVAAVHLGVFVLVCLLCHGELARDRPPADRLTAFYLWVSVGGVLGGLFNALAAPVLFAQLGSVEYPLAIVLAGLVRPNGSDHNRRPRWDDFAFPALLGLVAAGLVLLAPTLLGEPPTGDAGAELLDRLIRAGITFGLPAATAFALVWRPFRFALALAAVFLAGSLDRGRDGETLAVTRDFFGTLRVTRNGDGFVRLWHGTTQHGMQKDDDREHPAPLMYYHRKGPLGRYFAAVEPARLTRVGVVGLGCGATAAYAEPHQVWTFFEIDPAVIRVANEQRFFTYLWTCRAGNLKVVPGDARRQLAKESDGVFDLLVLDAFSSDAIPVHLLTAEAFRLYLGKLGPRGVLAFHLSNRYLDLPPLVARLAADADSSLVVVLDSDLVGDRAAGRSPSVWVFVARRREDLGEKRFGLAPLAPMRGPGWTDDWSNLLGVWKRGEE